MRILRGEKQGQYRGSDIVTQYIGVPPRDIYILLPNIKKMYSFKFKRSQFLKQLVTNARLMKNNIF